MPNTSKRSKPRRQRAQNKRRKRQTRRNAPTRPIRGGRPTLVLKAHALISQNISGVNIKQINIAPSLSIFGADVINQAKYFQQYRIPRVHVHFLNLDPVNAQQGVNYLQIPLVYQVPMINNQVPVAAQSAYLAYKNVRYFSYRRDFKRAFIPYVNTSTAQDRIFVRSPRLPTTSLDQLHFGLSFLFAKLSATLTTYTLKAVITADIQFYSYDGNQGVAYYQDQDLYDKQRGYQTKYQRLNKKSSHDQQKQQQIFEDIKQVTQRIKLQNIEQSQSQSNSSKLVQLLLSKLSLMQNQKHLRDIKLRTVQKNPGPIILQVEQDDQKPPDKI